MVDASLFTQIWDVDFMVDLDLSTILINDEICSKSQIQYVVYGHTWKLEIDKKI